MTATAEGRVQASRSLRGGRRNALAHAPRRGAFRGRCAKPDNPWSRELVVKHSVYPSPIFLTAFHCLDDAQSIASLRTTWFYDRTVCGGGIPNPEAKQVAGGATSIFPSASVDAALVLLNQMPPPLATYTGWDATTMQPSTPILAIHHPMGDVKKASFGTELGIYPKELQINMLGSFAAGTFYVVSWDLLRIT